MNFEQFTDPIFIAKLIDFVIFVGAIVFVYQKWGKRALVAYQESQNKAVEDAIAQRAQSEQSVKAAAQAIEQAKLDARRMVDVGRSQADRLLADEVAAAAEQAKRVLTHANGEPERERYRVRRELLEETVERAHTRAQEIVKREITPAKQDELVQHAVSSIGADRA